MTVVDRVEGHLIVELDARERRLYGYVFGVLEAGDAHPGGLHLGGTLLAQAQNLEEAIELAGQYY